MTNTQTRSGFKMRVAALAVAAGLLAATAAGCGAVAQGGQGNGQPAATGTQTGTQTSAPAKPASTDAGASAATVPKPLAAAGEYAENVYDAAKARDWKTADAKLAALKDSTARLGGTSGAEDLGTLLADVSALEKAVGARDQQAALLTSNKAASAPTSSFFISIVLPLYFSLLVLQSRASVATSVASSRRFVEVRVGFSRTNLRGP
ncbi:MAG: hypothetical protein M3522_06715 [Actinomycetota bacterium]|nr:hypothetical protein [Actinomycetota bacterium]